MPVIQEHAEIHLAAAMQRPSGQSLCLYWQLEMQVSGKDRLDE
jgi:hypothetical protein